MVQNELRLLLVNVYDIHTALACFFNLYVILPCFNVTLEVMKTYPYVSLLFFSSFCTTHPTITDNTSKCDDEFKVLHQNAVTHNGTVYMSI